MKTKGKEQESTAPEGTAPESKREAGGESSPNPPKPAAKDPEVDAEAVRKEAIAAERKRVKEIHDCVRKAGLKDEFARKLCDKDIEIDAARAAVIDKLAERDEKTDTRTAMRVEAGDRDEIKTRMEGAEKALLHRYDPVNNELPEHGREFRGMSMIEFGRSWLHSKGVDVRGWSKDEIATRSLGTGDFTSILANVANNTLRMAYDDAPQSFRPIVRVTSAPDFKQIQRTQLGEGPDLEEVLEDGEFQYGTVGESKETYSVLTYGKMICVTRKALINDDMDAFTRLPMMLGRRAAAKESDLVWNVFTSNPAMNDGNNLFDNANHGNSGTNGTITVDNLAAGREAMRLQTGVDGHEINVYPEYLIVPANLETKAEKFISTNLMAEKGDNINPFAGRLQLLVEPRLDANDTTAWYLAASPSQIDTIELAYLEGQRGVYLDTKEGWSRDGVEWKVRLDVGVAPIDWRGLYRETGGD